LQSRDSASANLNINTGIDNITGDVEEVKGLLTSADKLNAQSASFQIFDMVPVQHHPRQHKTPQNPNQHQNKIQQVPQQQLQQQQVVTLNLILSNKTISLNSNNIGSPEDKRTLVDVAQKYFKEPPVAAISHTGLQKGNQIDNYQLIKKLGSGFTSEVWKAEVIKQAPGVNLQLGETVAMKQYNNMMQESYANSIRIQREFKVASEMDNDNLVKVHDLMIAPIRPFSSFMIMEYVPGETLKDKIPKDGFDSSKCIEIGKQIAGALAALHTHGAIHRDVKPANIMLFSENPLKLKLLDLGIVSLMRETGFTEASIFLGSKHTASLEQLLGKDVDKRADVYALGATLLHCYTGQPMYNDSGPATAIVASMLKEPASCSVKDLANFEPKCSSLVEFINSCIHIDPASRPSDAQTCLNSLSNL